MNPLFVRLIFAFGALTLLQACKSTEPTGERALVETFTKDAEELNTQYKAFHSSKDSTRFYIKIKTDNLLYMKNSDDKKQASVIIKITPIALGDTPHEIKSKSIRIVDVDEATESKILLGSTLMYLPAGHNYEINTTVTDENRQQTYTADFYCPKEDHRARENFVATKEGMAAPLFKDRIEPNTTYQIQTGKSLETEIFVRYYNRVFPRPLPPFVMFEHEPFDYEADSLFKVSIDENRSFQFTSTDQGFYHFQVDTSTTEGFSLFVSSSEFPEVKSIDQMIDPFRYLVGKKDYLKVENATNKRAELENFWIEWAGTKDRARQAIESYYNRVEEANRLFSSYIEGWKSDRGIVYAIYGKPNKVYYKSNVETWIYGEEDNPLSITFNFVQVINPFSDNDFRLIRDEIYKPSWYHALNAVRYGKNK